jgi:hypothetical protein
MAKEVVKDAAQHVLPVAEHPIPTVEFATANNTLDPIFARRGVIVTIAFASMTSAYQIQLHWDGPEGPGRPSIPVKDGSDDRSIQINVAAEVIGACIGKTVEVWYTATLNGRTEPSIKLELTVETLKPEFLPASTFLDVDTSQGARWLDMRKFEDNARVALERWNFIAEGQRLWILAIGNEHHVGNFRFEWVLENHLVKKWEAQGGFVFLEHLCRDWLAGCEDYSSVTLCAAVTFDGAPGTAPADPTLSWLPANAHELSRNTENLRLGEPDLKLLMPRVLEATECAADECLLNPINATEGATIRVAYNGMRDTDRVCAFFEGAPGAGTPSLACVSGTTNGFVDIPVPASAISANFCGQVRVRYTVQRDRQWPSPVLTLKVLKLTGLSTPEVRQATARMLDLNTFNDDADVMLESWPFIAEGQPTWLWGTGKSEDGTPYSFDVLMGDALPAWEGEIAVRDLLPRHEIEKLADCTGLQLHFAVNFNGLIDHPSAVKFPSLALSLHQQDLHLIAPTVRQAVGELLNPENAKEGLTVRVAYDRISPRHTIQPYWVRPDGYSLPIEAKPGNSIVGYVDFEVPFNEVIACIGKTVTLRYDVTSPCKQATSPDFNLQISVPKHWPIPQVLQATNDILDLRNFDDDGTVLVEPWNPWMVEGQRVWLSCAGTDKDGNCVVLDLMVGELVSEPNLDDGLTRDLPRKWLQSLKDFSTFSLICKVTLDGSESTDKAVVLTPRELTIRFAFDDLTTFDDGNWKDWERGVDMRPQDLILQATGGTGHLVSDSANKPVGVLMTKYFDNLQPHVTYEFSLSVRRRNFLAPVPSLSLRAGSTAVTEHTFFPHMSWKPLSGTFVATQPRMQLWVESHSFSYDGNDFDIDDVRLREL